MSLESILDHILDVANAEKDKIIKESKQETDKIIQAARRDAETLYQEILSREKALYESQKQKTLVSSRLEAKKNTLKAKQELIDSVFEKVKSDIGKGSFKKELISQDKTQEAEADIGFYINKLRADYETEIAKILFG